MKLLRAEHYYHALLRGIPKAKKRVIIQAMVVVWGGRTEAIIPLLEAALRRGVEVRIVGDTFSKYEARTAKIARRGAHFNWQKTLDIASQLRAAGAHITYVGTLGINPFRRRTHCKITLIDDTVYTFGGVNFSDSHFTYQDFMLELKDGQVADRLHHLIRDIEAGGRLPDIIEPFGDASNLLFDGGTPGQSIIYDTACELVAEAKTVYYVSKMCPSGRLARLLRRTDYHAYFNRPELEGPPENIAIKFDQARGHIINSYTGSARLHAKFILTENADGSRHVITGSNNFAHRGVAFGTKEIAVHSTDRKLWQHLYDFLQKEVIS